MRSNDLNCCCGIALLTEFGNTDVAIVQTKFKPKDVEEFLVDREKDYRILGKAALMATLNGDQMKILRSTFKNQGFKVVSKAYHPNHNTYIYTLIKNLRQK